MKKNAYNKVYLRVLPVACQFELGGPRVELLSEDARTILKSGGVLGPSPQEPLLSIMQSLLRQNIRFPLRLCDRDEVKKERERKLDGDACKGRQGSWKPKGTYGEG